MKRKTRRWIFAAACAAGLAVAGGCSGCQGERADDVSAVEGLYAGEARLEVPVQLREMLRTAAPEWSEALDGPVACKVRLRADSTGGVTMTVEEVAMPTGGARAVAVGSSVTREGRTYRLEGEGRVEKGNAGATFSLDGQVHGRRLEVEVTVPVGPMLVEPRVVFEGRREQRGE